MAVALARIRMPLVWGSVVFVVIGTLLGLPLWLPLIVLAVALAIYFRIGTVRQPPIGVGLPVIGRWKAFNGPADKIPSHGLHAYGQTYAVDLIHVPTEDGGITMEAWPLTRPPTDFPAFDQPVVSPVDGEVVRLHQRARDHKSRTSWVALAYLLVVEALVREARGPKAILGNHVIIRTDDGVFAVLAHLQRGSVRVRVGDRVVQGESIASCGNSGNSSEPHVHFHLMDYARPVFAAGLPLSFDRFEVDGERRSGVPDSAQLFVVPSKA